MFITTSRRHGFNAIRWRVAYRFAARVYSCARARLGVPQRNLHKPTVMILTAMLIATAASAEDSIQTNNTASGHPTQGDTAASGSAEPTAPATAPAAEPPEITVPPRIEIEAAKAGDFPIQLSRRVEDLPPGTCLRILGLPNGVTLSGGQSNPGRGWIVPLWAMDGLKIHLSEGISGEHDLLVALVDHNGEMIFNEQATKLRIKAAAAPTGQDSTPSIAAEPPAADQKPAPGEPSTLTTTVANNPATNNTLPNSKDSATDHSEPTSRPFTLTSADFTANGGNGVKLSKQVGLPGNHRHTTGIAVADPSSTDFDMAKELTKVLAADGVGSLRDLQIYPTVGPGGLQTVRDVLTLPSTDLAIASIPIINKLRAARTYGDIGQQLVLVGTIMTEELHVLAPKHITDIHDLAGKTVSLGPTGSLSATLGHDILAALDVKAREVNVDFDKAIGEIRAGKIAAILLISGKPVRHIAEHALPAELHFLSVPYLPAFEGDFVRSALTHDDYPRVIEGTEVGTIGIHCALWAYQWPEQSERFRLVEMVIEGLAQHLHELQSGANHPKWKETDLSGSVSGWSRFDLSKAARAQNGKPKL
jgi:uncharacterized protein